METMFVYTMKQIAPKALHVPNLQVGPDNLEFLIDTNW